MRMLRSSDLDAYAEFYSKDEFARFVGGMKDREQSWRSMALLVGHWHLKGFGYWVVEEKGSGSFVGCVGLWKSEGWPEMELGYWITPEHHGKGYATEACIRAKEYARTELKRDTLVSYISPDNEASKRVAQRLGAHYEKTIELLDHGPHEVWRHQL